MDCLRPGPSKKQLEQEAKELLERQVKQDELLAKLTHQLKVTEEQKETLRLGFIQLDKNHAHLKKENLSRSEDMFEMESRLQEAIETNNESIQRVREISAELQRSMEVQEEKSRAAAQTRSGNSDGEGTATSEADLDALVLPFEEESSSMDSDRPQTPPRERIDLLIDSDDPVKLTDAEMKLNHVSLENEMLMVKLGEAAMQQSQLQAQLQRVREEAVNSTLRQDELHEEVWRLKAQRSSSQHEDSDQSTIFAVLRPPIHPSPSQHTQPQARQRQQPPAQSQQQHSRTESRASSADADADAGAWELLLPENSVILDRGGAGAAAAARESPGQAVAFNGLSQSTVVDDESNVYPSASKAQPLPELRRQAAPMSASGVLRASEEVESGVSTVQQHDLSARMQREARRPEEAMASGSPSIGRESAEVEALRKALEAERGRAARAQEEAATLALRLELEEERRRAETAEQEVQRLRDSVSLSRNSLSLDATERGGGNADSRRGGDGGKQADAELGFATEHRDRAMHNSNMNNNSGNNMINNNMNNMNNNSSCNTGNSIAASHAFGVGDAASKLEEEPEDVRARPPRARGASVSAPATARGAPDPRRRRSSGVFKLNLEDVRQSLAHGGPIAPGSSGRVGGGRRQSQSARGPGEGSERRGSGVSGRESADMERITGYALEREGGDESIAGETEVLEQANLFEGVEAEAALLFTRFRQQWGTVSGAFRAMVGEKDPKTEAQHDWTRAEYGSMAPRDITAHIRRTKISWQDWLAGLRKYCPELSVGACKRIFEAADLNHDNELDHHEFYVAHKAAGMLSTGGGGVFGSSPRHSRRRPKFQQLPSKADYVPDHRKRKVRTLGELLDWYHRNPQMGSFTPMNEIGEHNGRGWETSNTELNALGQHEDRTRGSERRSFQRLEALYSLSNLYAPCSVPVSPLASRSATPQPYAHLPPRPSSQSSQHLRASQGSSPAPLCASHPRPVAQLWRVGSTPRVPTLSAPSTPTSKPTLSPHPRPQPPTPPPPPSRAPSRPPLSASEAASAAVLAVALAASWAEQRLTGEPDHPSFSLATEMGESPGPWDQAAPALDSGAESGLWRAVSQIQAHHGSILLLFTAAVPAPPPSAAADASKPARSIWDDDEEDEDAEGEAGGASGFTLVELRREHFERSLRSLQVSLSASEATQSFAALDSLGSGSVSMSALRAALLLPEVQAAIAALLPLPDHQEPLPEPLPSSSHMMPPRDFTPRRALAAPPPQRAPRLAGGGGSARKASTGKRKKQPASPYDEGYFHHIPSRSAPPAHKAVTVRSLGEEIDYTYRMTFRPTRADEPSPKPLWKYPSRGDNASPPRVPQDPDKTPSSSPSKPLQGFTSPARGGTGARQDRPTSVRRSEEQMEHIRRMGGWSNSVAPSSLPRP